MTISAPTLDQAIAGLSGLALIAPENTARHAYVDADARPHDLLGHFYRDLGGDPRVFLGKDSRGKLLNALRISSIWEDVFSGFSPVVHLEGEGPQSWRLREPEDWSPFLAYGLMGHVQTANDHSGRDWRGSVLLGVRNFRRFLVSKSSGFLVQLPHDHDPVTHKALPLPQDHPAREVLARADEATKLMRVALA